MTRAFDRQRRAALSTALACGMAPLATWADAPAQPAGRKVLRYAFRVAETGFDPARVGDLYSRSITPHIFEGLYTYDHLARPFKLKPLIARELPEVSEDYRVFTVRIRPGVFFTDDPAFGGKPRELVAQDFVYSFKRFADPVNNSSAWSDLAEADITGLSAYREQVRRTQQPFDYDRPIEGLKALDRYTLQFRLNGPRPRFVYALAQSDLFGAVPREVVEAHGGSLMEHPVGTGPFVLKQWRRSSLIVLERNPNYRERYYDAEPAADDAEGQALLARFKGRRLPMVDRVEVAIIEENQPRWLSFLDGQFDLIYQMPEDFVQQAMPRGQLAPNLQKKGMKAWRTLNSDLSYSVFNMEDPVLGGYAPERVALRRAIALGTDVQREIQLARRGQALRAQSFFLANTTGFDLHYRGASSVYDPARAKALLDMYGYHDVDGDGWREQPNGDALSIEAMTTPDAFQRQIDEIFQKNMAALGIRLRFKVGKWPENYKALRAGKYQMWWVGTSASTPDGIDSMGRLASERIGLNNFARFRNNQLDQLFARASALPDGPERLAVFAEAKRIAATYIPYIDRLHRYYTDIAQPQLLGFRRPVFWLNWWEYVDIDPALQKGKA